MRECKPDNTINDTSDTANPAYATTSIFTVPAMYTHHAVKANNTGTKSQGKIFIPGQRRDRCACCSAEDKKRLAMGYAKKQQAGTRKLNHPPK
jgi:hypothetical protein